MAIECTANNLATLADCFVGLTPRQKAAADIYLLATAIGASTDPNTLAAAADCFIGLSAVQHKAIQTYLLCQANA